MSVSPSDQELADPPVRWQREVRLAAIVIFGSLLILPALIYVAGTAVLGAYAGGDHIGAFYGDFLRNLGTGTLRTWLLLLAPYLVLNMLRAIFWPWNRGVYKQPTVEDPEPIARRSQTPAPKNSVSRRDPFVGQ